MDDFKELILRQFKIDLLERDKNPITSIYKLKYNYDYSDICFIVDNLKIKNQKIDDLIYGCTTPETISELGDTKVIFGDSYEELEKELNWALLAIRKYHTDVSLFLNYKDKYEKELLLGHYRIAEDLLTKIEKEICVSLWGIEQRFILIEIQKGLKENTSFLNEINEKNKKWFIKYFSHFFSIKSEKELSVNQYQLALARLLYKYYENKKHVDLSYYNFKLNFLEEPSLQYLPIFLTVEGYHSIIDRYITLIRIFQLEIIKNKKENKSLIDSRLFYLSKKINDPSIGRMRLIYDSSFDFELPISTDDRSITCSIDEYTKGNYESAEKLLHECLIKYPQAIEIYELYIKTLLIQDKPFTPLNQNIDSFQNRILNDFYTIQKKESDINEALNDLRRIAYNLSSFLSVSFFLMNYYKIEVERKDDFRHISLLNSYFLNPTVVGIIQKTNSKYSALIDSFSDSPTYNLLTLDYNNITKIESIKTSNLRKEILKAKFYQQSKRYQDAIGIWESLLSNDQTKNFQKISIISNLFYCKLSENKIDDCIEIYVNNYFANPLIINKIDASQLKKRIKKERFKNIIHTINLPIFYKITESDDYEVHTAYECYLLKNDSTTPTELITKNLVYDKKKYIFFLESICTLDIFKHSPFITSSQQKINERIAICKFLSEIDQESKETHLQEVERLTKKQIIQKGLQEIDESKIYVNQQGIIDTELKNLKSLFNRYKAIGELKSEKDISIVTLYSDKVLSFKLSEKDDESESEFSKDPQFDIFKDIFNYLLDKFLFSNYGLQQYLSARIRHGVLLGEIRPEFEILNLITEKEKGIDAYKKNTHWNYSHGILSEEKIDKCQEYLAKFSREIDNLINDEILLKYLQIKVEDKNPDGWLDYIFNDSTLQVYYVLFKTSNDLNDFINNMFEIFWERTILNLEKIRNIINGEIKEKFLTHLSQLENNLDCLFGRFPIELFNNITEARINIENKLNKIANWFNITESNISDFKISKIIDVSLECTQSSTHNRLLKPYLNIDSTCEINGSFFPSLVDLMRIFFDNVLKHSGFDEGEIPISIKINENDDELNIKIQNPLNATVDINELKTKINSFRLDLNKSMYEDRSGFHKALRIIKSDLNNSDNDMTLSLENDDTFTISILIKKENIII